MKKKPTFFSLASRSHNVAALKQFLERYMRFDGFAPLQREVNGEKIFFVEKTRQYTAVSCLGIWVGKREAKKLTYPAMSYFMNEVIYGDSPAPYL